MYGTFITLLTWKNTKVLVSVSGTISFSEIWSLRVMFCALKWCLAIRSSSRQEVKNTNEELGMHNVIIQIGI